MNKTLAVLTDTGGSSGHVAGSAVDVVEDVRVAREVGLTVASRRTRWNMSTTSSELAANLIKADA